MKREQNIGLQRIIIVDEECGDLVTIEPSSHAHKSIDEVLVDILKGPVPRLKDLVSMARWAPFILWLLFIVFCGKIIR